jgi:hypothetical protein
MKIEMVFRIYRKLMKRSGDFCAKVVIIPDEEADLITDPTAIKVKFIPKTPRRLKSTERSILKHFCEYHNVEYYVNMEGEMIWQDQPKTEIPGKRRSGKMLSPLVFDT